jgi:hypothetical protein
MGEALGDADPGAGFSIPRAVFGLGAAIAGAFILII